VRDVQSGEHPIRTYVRAKDHVAGALSLAADLKDGRIDPSDVPAVLREEYILSGPLYDIPGGCLVDVLDDGWRIGVYDVNGAAIHYRITFDGHLIIEEDQDADGVTDHPQSGS